MSVSERSPLSKGILLGGSAIFLHAAYSTYEFISVQKSLGLVQGNIPSDVTIELFVGMAVIVFGLVATASPLRDITWASEYRKRTIDEVDARPSFVALNHRGPILFGNRD